jgi:hypothetical protein
MPSDTDPTLAAIRSALKSQFHAALAMLRFAILQCPDDLWAGGGYINPTWRIAYHTLFYTHFYLQPRAEDFTPWEHHQTGLHDLDEHPSPPEIQDLCEHPHRPPQTGEPLSKAQLLDYWTFCDDYVDRAVDALDLMSTDSGFSWYPIPKLEHQFVNIRHIQHHAAQIGHRLREASGGVNIIDWVGAGRRERSRLM